MKTIIPFLLLCLLVQGCGSSSRFSSNGNKVKNKYPNETVKSESDEKTEEPVIKDEYANAPVLETQTGIASYYSDKFDGKKTYFGEVFKKNDLTAAHLKYPYNTVLRVINLLNNKSVVLRINDRKPDFNGRIIDVSYGAAKILGMIKSGITEVRIEVLKWGKDNNN
jgi:rare lipoprotein A (peptidoglycan hydrolase)